MNGETMMVAFVAMWCGVACVGAGWRGAPDATAERVPMTFEAATVYAAGPGDHGVDGGQRGAAGEPLPHIVFVGDPLGFDVCDHGLPVAAPGLPAVTDDGRLEVVAVGADDGERANPDLALVVRRTDGGEVVRRLVVVTGEDAGSCIELMVETRERVEAANRALAELFGGRGAVEVL